MMEGGGEEGLVWVVKRDSPITKNEKDKGPGGRGYCGGYGVVGYGVGG